MLERERRMSQAVAVACPGGIARQFRVQVREAAAASTWKLVGSFSDSISAQACADAEQSGGRLTRVIACRLLPTAL